MRSSRGASLCTNQIACKFESSSKGVTGRRIDDKGLRITKKNSKGRDKSKYRDVHWMSKMHNTG